MKIKDVHFTAGRSGPGPNGRVYGFEPWAVIEDLPSFSKDFPYRAVKIPRRGVYDRGGALYFRELGGVCEFFFHDPGDQAGYGGEVFEGILENGERFSVKGPWSSSCQDVMALGLSSEPILGVAVKDPTEKWECYTHRTLSLSLLREISDFCPDWGLFEPETTPERPFSASMSDEQNVVIELTGGPKPSGLPYFYPLREIPPCPGCKGEILLLTEEDCDCCEGTGENSVGGKCFRCDGRRKKREPCPICGRRFCSAGLGEYPNLRLQP